MDVKEAIDDLLHVLDLHRHDYTQEDYIKESFHMAIKALERTRWIPVSERLPEKNGQYLVYSGWVRTLLCMYGVWGCNPDEVTVTHWMPLPKPPEVEHD